jgi:hypothetical protein
MEEKEKNGNTKIDLWLKGKRKSSQSNGGTQRGEAEIRQWQESEEPQASRCDRSKRSSQIWGEDSQKEKVVALLAFIYAGVPMRIGMKTKKESKASRRKWSAGVKTTSTYPPEGLFTRSAPVIARTLAKKKSPLRDLLQACGCSPFISIGPEKN